MCGFVMLRYFEGRSMQLETMASINQVFFYSLCAEEDMKADCLNHRNAQDTCINIYLSLSLYIYIDI